MVSRKQKERQKVGRLGWLRAAVLGANDGLLSTASVIIGVASARTSHASILIAGVAALIAGAMSMAAGEYVSVSSQADSEKADLRREAEELKADPKGERTGIGGHIRQTRARAGPCYESGGSADAEGRTESARSR
jgi:VIT1/CCC1 family predicted Fe2+/Mn2+ transporter